eukprot:IDg10641t1
MLCWLFPGRLAKNRVEENQIVFASASFTRKQRTCDGIQYVSRTRNRLPGEGKLFDSIGLSNFVDLEKNKFTAALNKTFRIDVLSKLFDVELPAKLTLGGRLGTLWVDGLDVNPVGKVSMSVQLLDLGAADSRQSGWLKYKATMRTNGKMGHGFEIDRRVSVHNMQNTMVYGKVTYNTNNKANGEWKSRSDFGIHQDFRLMGLRFAARVGMTPE